MKWLQALIFWVFAQYLQITLECKCELTFNMLGVPVRVYKSLDVFLKMFQKEKDHKIENTELSLNTSLISLTILNTKLMPT